jgi:molybdopterin-guanine dinucleotide biosynthesis protein A
VGLHKALLPIGSRTLIEVVIERIRPLVEQVVVIGSLRNAKRLGERLAHRVLTDLKPDCGPLMGLYTGLMRTETPLNLFVPCDMPWVEGRLVERLLASCRHGVEVVASKIPQEELHPSPGRRRNADGPEAHSGLRPPDRWWRQPFPLICHVNACRAIGALLDRRARSIQTLLDGPHTQVIRIEEPDLWRSFTNVNTLSDYAALTEAAVAP